MMVIKKEENNGTMSYSGATFELLDYFAKALDIRQDHYYSIFTYN